MQVFAMMELVLLMTNLMLATGRSCFIPELSGASSETFKDVHRAQCDAIAEHVFIEQMLVSSSSASAQKRSPSHVGACVDRACEAAEIPGLIPYLEGHFSKGCRDGHPTTRHAWPAEDELKVDGYFEWMERLDKEAVSWIEMISWESIYECPAASCAILATHSLHHQARDSKEVFLSIFGVKNFDLEDSKLFLLDVAQRMQFCYDEILSNAHQQDLFVKLGLIVAVLELALARLRSWAHEIQPRNPHHEEGRLVWHDHYSGLYPPVNYAEQFDLQWRLALEQPGSDFGQESSVRLDNCSMNDMIASTFGRQNFLYCNESAREVHESLERGISQQNIVTLDISRFMGATALDVGCGFGRWTAMLQHIGAKVTSVDASPHAVISTRRFNPDTHQMTLFELPTLENFEAGFDTVICWGVLHHTHDPYKGFKIVASALREGGFLFIQVYNDRAKAGFHYTQSFRTRFHQLKTIDEKVHFLRKTHRAAGAAVEGPQGAERPGRLCEETMCC